MASVQMQRAQGGMRLQARQSVRVEAKVATKSASTKVKTTNLPMVCVDCGYLYDGKKGAFEDLPKSYSCPVCGAPKNRFKGYQGNVSRSNDNKTMASRRDALREQLAKRGESVGEDASFLLVTAASAAVFLGAVYYFTAIAR